MACGNTLQRPPERTLVQKLATRGAYLINGVQSRVASPRPNWMHVRLIKENRGSDPMTHLVSWGLTPAHQAPRGRPIYPYEEPQEQEESEPRSSG